MKKLFLLALVAAGLVAFVGVDVVKGALSRARDGLRETLTADVPLRTQIAEAQAQIDAYAESVIRGEVAAENLADMIADVEREVRALETKVEGERAVLTALRRSLEVVPASTAPTPSEREAMRRARIFTAQALLLQRRQEDLVRLRREHETTLANLEAARAEQARLTDEVQVLAAEVESLEARTAAARTREAAGESAVSRSGYAEAQARLQRIRTAVKEQNKLLEYYEYERRPVTMEGPGAVTAEDGGADVRAAVDEALASFPER